MENSSVGKIVSANSLSIHPYLDELTRLLKEKTQTDPVFYDIVSVEHKENKNYEVYWFGPNEEFLNKYYQLINAYFNPGKQNKSLLFLSNTTKKNSRHEFINICKEKKETKVSLEKCLIEKFVLDKHSQIDNEQTEIEKWKSEILLNLNVPHITFSKITFNIGAIDYTAAIWVGYAESTGNISVDDVFFVYLERFLWAYALNIIVPETQKELKRQAIRAAISQVMARNMSHNIGSHVMNKLVDAETLRTYLAKDKPHFYFSKINLEEENIIKDAFDLVAIYNNYVKCRMDYLADITFGTPVMQTNKLVFGEIFADLDANRLLLDNISGINDFYFEIEFQYQGCILNRENDIRIAMPNDVLGCQALYNIIENVIRNTAKHNQEKKDSSTIDNPTKFIINITECEFDRKLYVVEIYDDVPPDDVMERVENQNTTIDKHILDEETNSLRNTALGMIEMEASAAYLRKLEITEIDSDEYDLERNDSIKNSKGKLNILKAFNKNDCLGYKYFVHKPTEFLLITDTVIEESRKDELLRNGVWVETKDEFTKKINEGLVYNHQFLIYDVDIADDLLKNNKTALPTRFLNIKTDKSRIAEIKECLTKNKFDFTESEAIIWKWWRKEILQEREINTVFFGENLNYDNNKEKFYNAAMLNHAEAWNPNKGIYKLYSKDLTVSDYFSYVEPLSSKAQQALPGFGKEMDIFFNNNNGDGYNRNMLWYSKFANKCDLINAKLAEAVISKVLVIDERIQFASKNKKYSEAVPFKDIYDRTGVLLPEFDLGHKNYKPELIGKIKEYVATESEKLNAKTDFILIHYSILERMFNNKTEINIFLEKYSENKNVAVTSGRGKPSELPPSVRYINLSPITNAFIDIRSKYLINYLLHSSRK